MKLETLCVQEGYTPKNGEPRVLPICQSTTFKYDSSDYMGKLFDLEESGFFYTRLANPTSAAVEKKISVSFFEKLMPPAFRNVANVVTVLCFAVIPGIIPLGDISLKGRIAVSKNQHVP